jgi:hypothetical protein
VLSEFKITIVIFSFFLFGAILNSEAQTTTIWQEDFTYSDGTITGEGSPSGVASWTAEGYNGNSGITVYNNALLATRSSSGNRDTWETDLSIDISAYADVEISLDVFGFGDMESSDYLRVYYNLDNTGWQFFSNNGNLNDNNWSPVVASQTGLNGTSLSIRIVMVNSSTDEYYYADNIVVTGTPPCTAIGDPSIFGDSQWNVYAYNGDDIDLNGLSYRGYYTESSLTFDSRNRWDGATSPSNASGYLGCTVDNNNHTVVYKRTNFSCGTYQIDVTGHDDGARLYIDGSQVWEHIGCCDSHTNVWTGLLDSNSTVEFRVEEQAGQSSGALVFTSVETSLGADFSASPTTVNAGVSVSFSDLSSGSPNSYLWSFPGGDPSSSTSQNPTVTYNAGGTYDVSLTISDDCGEDTQTKTGYITVASVIPSVSLSIDNPSILENGGEAVITATLSNAYSQAVTIYLDFSGTAANSSDYSKTSNSIEIPAGSLSGTVTITGIDDCYVEGDETILVDVSSVTNGTESGNQQVTTSIIDDDFYPTITLSANNSSIPEDGGSSIVTATLSNTFCADITIYFNYSGSAVHPNDYSNPTYSVLIPSGSLTEEVAITSVNDYLVESDETVIVSVGSTNIAGISTSVTPTTITINDDDSYSITVSPTSGLITTEDGGTATFTVVLNAITYNDVTISLTSDDISEGTASPSSLTFTPSNYNVPQTVTINGIDDGSNDGDVNYSIITSAASSFDNNFNGSNPQDLSVTNIDNEIVVDECNFSLTATTNTVECQNSINGTIDLTVPYPIQFNDPDYIDLGNMLMSNLSQFTLEGWIKVDLSTIGSRISLFGQNDAIEFGFENASSLGCWTPWGGSVSTNAYPADNGWHHVAAVGDGNSITLYIDGAVVTTGGNTTGNYGTSTYTSKIGAGVWDPSGGSFPGQMIKVGFWNSALSPGEIGNLASGFYQYTGSESGLLAGFNFYEGSGTALTSVPAGNDGTFSGSPTWQDDYSYLWTKSGDTGFSATTQDLSGVEPGTYTVVVSNTSMGCASNGSWTIDYSDTTDPTAVCQDITIALDNSGNATITPSQVDSGSNDNCTPSGSLGLSLDVSSFTCSDLGDNTVTLTVTDESGNVTTCSSVVSVVDTEAPTAICQDISVTIGAGGQATVAAADVDNGSMDNCTSSGNLIVKIDGQDQLTFDCTNVGGNTVTLSVEDESGNSSTCQAQVTIVNAAPSFSSCPADISVDLTSADVGGYWQYRKPITITNSGSTLTDYQVRVDVPMETGKMNADFSDIRFRDSDGSTSLSFWLEQQDGSTAVFWVNVPSIGASKTIYLLYGNSVATSASNSSNTFIYFDDMNTASGWADVANGGSVTTNSSVFGYNVLVKQDNDDPSGGQKSIGTTISDFKLITREQRASTGPGGASNGGAMDRYGLEDGSGNGYTLTRNADVSSTGTFGFERRTNGSASGGSASNVSQPRDNWYITELEKNGSAFVANIYEDNHSNLLGSEYGTDPTYNTFTHLAVRGGHFYYIDWMAVAKSAPTEPSLSFGTEEVLGVASCEKDVTVPLPSVSDDSGTFTLTNDFNGGSDASGTYPVGTTTVTFTATDPCGETATCSLDVTVNDKIDPIIACDGDITAEATDNPLTIPKPSFDDNCSEAVLTNDFNNGTDDASGDYPIGTTTVVWTVTDVAGNTATCSFDVTINEVCAISDVSYTPVTCAGDDDASIQITATGYGQLSYSIDGGENFQTGNTFSDLAPGTYDVQISDESGCTTTWPTPIIIYEANDFSVSSSVTDVSCFGNSDGAIDATLNSYLTQSIYFDGSDDYIALNQSYSGTSAIPELTVCAWVKCDPGDGGWSVLDLDRSEYFNVSLGGTNRSGSTVEFATNSDLGGGIDDMVGTVDVKDGQWHHIAAVYDGADKYLYVDGVLDSQKSNPHNGQPLGSNQTRYGFIGDGSEASSYDASRNNTYYKGWIAQVDLWERVLTADEIKQRMHSELAGSETSLAGNWSMEEGTGTSVSPQGTMFNGPSWTDDIPYSYSWTKQGDGSFSANTLDISGLSAGTYNLTVTFDGACVKTASVEVTEPDELVVTPTISQISCDGLTDGAIDITVSGGTESYTFEWSTLDGSGLVSTDEDQTELGVGTYDVTVTDANSCVANGSYTITQPSVYSVIISDQADPSTCGGNDGVIELTLTNVPDGLYDITYDGGTFTGVSVSGELATISDLSAGAYNNLRLTVVTCVTSDDPDVVLTDPPTPDIAELSLAFSGGNDVCLDAAATIDVTSSSLADGTYTVTYDLSAPNESTDETATLTFASGSGSFTTVALSNTGTTSLSIAAIESNGCSVAVSASVDLPVDITPPVIGTCPADASATCVENIEAGVTSYEDFSLIGTVSDNCTSETNLTVEFSDVTDKKDETNSCEVKRTYTITDEAGNSQTCTQTFTITDSTPPVIQDCPNDIFDFADSNCEKIMSIIAPSSFSDGCGFGNITVYHEYTIESITVNGTGDLVDVAFPKGTTVVSWSFEDECGNIGTCETEVTINDVTEPTASTPANQDLDAARGCSVLIPDYSSLLTDLSDNCDPSPSITQEPFIGTEVFADTDIELVFTDASGNKDSVIFTAVLTNLAPLTISGMTYDGGQSGTGAVGSGQKPFITSTHTYVVDATEPNPENYTYTWLVLDQSGTDVTPSISFNNTDQTSGDILFEETSVTSGNTYTIRVIKEQINGNCSAVFEFDVDVQETNFNSGVSPLGDTCQDGGTGTTTVVFWDIDFTGGVEPYAFDFTVSDGTDGCTGSVSNLYTSDAQSISTSESCDGTYVVSITKTSGDAAVQVAFIFTNQAAVDKDFNLTIDSATDNFSITKQTTNTDEDDDVIFWGVPNTSEITTD